MLNFDSYKDIRNLVNIENKSFLNYNDNSSVIMTVQKYLSKINLKDFTSSLNDLKDRDCASSESSSSDSENLNPDKTLSEKQPDKQSSEKQKFILKLFLLDFLTETVFEIKFATSKFSITRSSHHFRNTKMRTKDELTDCPASVLTVPKLEFYSTVILRNQKINRTTGSVPYRYRPHQISKEHHAALHAEIQRLENLGFIKMINHME